MRKLSTLIVLLSVLGLTAAAQAEVTFNANGDVTAVVVNNSIDCK